MSTVYLGTLAHLTANPFETSDALEIIEFGALWVDEKGMIIDYGKRSDILAKVPEAWIEDYDDAWLIPGMIDGHVHYPQYYATAAQGGQLLDWLVQSILPAETAFADPAFANDTAKRFIRHLLSCGTTTAMVFGSQFAQANEALFIAAKELGIRLISGATLMDTPADGIPKALLQTPKQAQADAEKLIAICLDEPLLHYAITPRYALSCSEEMMMMCHGLLHNHPETYLQTHINENRNEIKAILAHFNQCKDYLEVYERYGLVTDRTVLAHNLHPSDGELDRIGQAQCSICHCPSSNLFLGSGLFPLSHHIKHGINIALGTDIGAGVSFSLWSNLSDAYKIQQLQGLSLNPEHLLYSATLGGAKALHLENETGNFSTGKSADFFVLDYHQSDYLSERLRRCNSLEAQLFCLLHLASERQVESTYVRGRRVFLSPS